MLPPLLPDMTLYSLIACAHRLRGGPTGAITSKILFGSPHAGLRHDFPSHLGEFSRRTNAIYGGPQEIAFKATVLPYFLRFRSKEIWDRAVSLMSEKSVQSLKFELGLPAGPSRSMMPLCYCARCACQDVLAHGVAYWHRKHQLPGIFICSQHGVPVHRSSIRTDRCGRLSFFLPGDPAIVCTATQPQLEPSQRVILLRLATLSTTFLETQVPVAYSREALHSTYRHGLKQKGFLTRRGQVRATQLVKWIRDQYHCISALEPYGRIVANSVVDGMLCMVRKPRRDFHPLCHLILIDALFGNWDLFASVYRWEIAMGARPQTELNLNFELNRGNLRAEKISSRLNRQHGVGTQALLPLDENLNIASHTGKCGPDEVKSPGNTRRAVLVSGDTKNRVIQMMKAGHAIKDIARMSSLSLSSIDRIVNEYPSLRQERWQARRLARYTTSQSKSPQKDQPRLRRPRVNWEERDRECACALAQVMSDIRFESWERLKPMVVLRKIPKLSFLPRLARLPESKVLVELILESARALRML